MSKHDPHPVWPRVLFAMLKKHDRTILELIQVTGATDFGVRRALDVMIEEGMVSVAGDGIKGSPFVYTWIGDTLNG